MIKLGFVSAILPDLDLKEVLDFAAATGYDCVEIMCWPAGKAARRYAGVTHIDVSGFTDSQAQEVQKLASDAGVSISGLGYYPNPLTPDRDEAAVAIDHIEKVIEAAARLEIGQANSFVGKDWFKSVDDNWPVFLEVWRPLVDAAGRHGVSIGIENCPMYFTDDEWPGGKNLMTTPEIWRRAFDDIAAPHFGLNYDPSHMIWQHMDYLAPLREFSDRIFHVHAKDARLDTHRLNEVGIMAHPLKYHTPKLPGFGDVNWGHFFSVLTDTGYRGAVCVEVEDRAYEHSLEARKKALVQSHDYLRQFIPR